MQIPGRIPAGEVRLFNQADPVSAAVTNVPIEQLAERYEALLRTLQANGIGENNRVFVSLEASTRVGSVVYPTETPGVFANAKYEIEQVADVAQQSRAASPLGVVAAKSGDQSGVVILSGSFHIRQDALEAVLDGPAPASSAIYLSAVPGAAGRLTTERTRFGVAVGWVTGPVAVDTDAEPIFSFFVKIEWQNPFDDHRHYGARVSTAIQSSDPTESGWLDVEDTYWASNGLVAPEGAVYGYLWKLDPQLRRVYPPYPVASAVYLVDGVQQDLLDPEALVIVDEYGIWWMNEQDDPGDVGDVHDLYFLRSTYRSSTAMVTSLTPSDATIVVEATNGSTSSVGDLRIRANFVLADDGGSDVGASAFKSVTNNQLTSGPVLAGVRTTTPDVVALAGTTFASGGHTYRAGLVTLAITDPSGVRTGPVEFVDLDGVSVEATNGVVSTDFPSGRASSVSLRIPVPAVSVSGTYDLRLRVTLWLRANGTPPNLALSQFKFTPSGSTPAAFSPVFTSMDPLSLSSVGSVTSGQAVELLSPALAVTAGDLLHLKLSRGASDSFGGPIGILRATWELTPVA